jgi:hypothetical protein
MTVAGSIRTAAHHMFKNGGDDLDLGPDHLRGADETTSVNRLLRKTENPGLRSHRNPDQQPA